MKTAIIAGASGLVGSYCLEYLLSDAAYSEVVVLGRRPSQVHHDKVKEVIVDYDRLPDYKDQMIATHAFCTLGTTIKKAGSKEAFKKVDLEYALSFARIVFANGCRNFNIVTALGADPDAFVFYNRVKGQVEKELSRIGFDRLNILQPSLLLGDRQENRLGENIAQKLFAVSSGLWVGPLKKYAGIKAKQVAKAMVAIAQEDQPGIYVYPSDQLQQY